MKLSKRLSSIASLVDTKRVIDVGCDHGYLDIYLTLYKDCMCIASDISDKAIKNCLENIKMYNLLDKIEVMVTDGINGISINNDDTLILSGMGTNTIKSILSNQVLCNTIIISSNNNLDELRYFMVDLGYKIINEVYVEENNIHYVIIKFIKGKVEYSKLDYLLGPIVKYDKDYQKYIYKHYQDLLDKVPDKYDELRNSYKSIINYLDNLNY